jgi:glycosyltransferase involved in cell wall biosynthesis
MTEQTPLMPFRQKYRIHAPYILYAGRIEKGKGLETVFEAFGNVVNQRLVDLVLIGRKLMPLPSIKRLRYLGFVSEKDKVAAFKGAVFSIQPSPLESLSITTLESFAQKTPVLVNQASPALVEHVRQSKGGFVFHDIESFCHHFYTFYDDRTLRVVMGQRGFDYVRKNYSWDIVIEKIKATLKQLLP